MSSLPWHRPAKLVIGAVNLTVKSINILNLDSHKFKIRSLADNISSTSYCTCVVSCTSLYLGGQDSVLAGSRKCTHWCPAASNFIILLLLLWFAGLLTWFFFADISSVSFYLLKALLGSSSIDLSQAGTGVRPGTNSLLPCTTPTGQQLLQKTWQRRMWCPHLPLFHILEQNSEKEPGLQT